MNNRVAWFAALMIAVWAPALASESFGITDKAKEKKGIKYLCTGTGESKENPPPFPAKIVFATVSSALYSDVNVRIYGEGREDRDPVFDVFCDGAWLLVDLPAGKYRVTATDQKNQSRECSMNVGSSQTMCVLRWPD